MTQVLNLEEYELDGLAGFLGHDLAIHREYYRLPENTVQLAKVVKILMAVNRGVSEIAEGKGNRTESHREHGIQRQSKI